MTQNKFQVKLQFTNDEAKAIYNNEAPRYETAGAVGIDLRAVDVDLSPENYLPNCLLEGNSFILPAGKRVLVKTGIKFEMPKSIKQNIISNDTLYTTDFRIEIQIRPRSGLALKKGITILNSPGTIDADYTKEIGAIIINHSNIDFKFAKGDRICQAVFNLVPIPSIVIDKVEENDRGGFGSTGINESETICKQ